MISEPRNGLFPCHAQFPDYQLVGVQGDEPVIRVRCLNPNCPLSQGITELGSNVALRWNMTVEINRLWLGCKADWMK